MLQKLLRKPFSLKHFLISHGGVVLAGLFVWFVWDCPMRRLFHFPCPGCGISRALEAATFHLDFATAFSLHPLFFAVPPLILYIAHRGVMKKRLSDKVELIGCICFCVAILGIYIVRILSNNWQHLV